MSWSIDEVFGADSLHREHCYQLEQCPASQQQCPARAVGVIDAGIWSIMERLQHIIKHILAREEDNPHLCRPISVGDARCPASARTVHAKSLQCARDPRHPDRD